jgi:CRP-like cAMP-binding protein
MDDSTPPDNLRTRLSRSGEDALGRLAQDLLENPLVSGAIARAFEAREKASQAQEVAMGALNLPSAADIERLTRRVRSVSQRLEGIEDGVDRLDERLAGLSAAAGLDHRLDAIEEHLARIAERLETQAKAEAKPARRAASARTARKPPAEKPPAAEPGHGARSGVA